MKLKTLIALAASVVVIATVQQAAAQPQVVSILLLGANQTNTVQIASFQYAKVLTATDADTSEWQGYYWKAIAGANFILGTSPAIVFNIPHVPQGEPVTLGNAPPLAGVTVAGPTSISVTTGPNSARNGPVLCNSRNPAFSLLRDELRDAWAGSRCGNQSGRQHRLG